MKKLAFLVLILLGIFLISCSNKKKDVKTDVAEPAAVEVPDTIVIGYGSVSVDSISPDSAAIVVQDTTVEIVAEPKDKK
jgi:hypothetical protein